MHAPLAGPPDALPPDDLAGDALARLAQKLTVEYAGACPCGDIVWLVHRADRLVGREHHLVGATRLETCESIARRLITDRLAVALRRERHRARVSFVAASSLSNPLAASTDGPVAP